MSAPVSEKSFSFPVSFALTKIRPFLSSKLALSPASLSLLTKSSTVVEPLTSISFFDEPIVTDMLVSAPS